MWSRRAISGTATPEFRDTIRKPTRPKRPKEKTA